MKSLHSFIFIVVFAGLATLAIVLAAATVYRCLENDTYANYIQHTKAEGLDAGLAFERARVMGMSTLQAVHSPQLHRKTTSTKVLYDGPGALTVLESKLGLLPFSHAP
ncbi:MAG: hypothetical protein RIE86_13275 [Imperialibacter sp.]|uniref:hypothetical protein n=1 Tax=Imperialibacter sp. TaxID=2038411 RepID=UPI0032EE4E37